MVSIPKHSLKLRPLVIRWSFLLGRQNVPSYATGENLDQLGEVYCQLSRPEVQPALATQRFEISEAQSTSILVPRGARVWCQTPGSVGNGYTLGQICNVVDLHDYYSVTTSGDGADQADDETYRRLMRDNMDTLSGAGARGGYAAVAKRVNTSIADDVLANQSAPGIVSIYVLMEDGTLAGEEVKTEVITAYIQRGKRSTAEVEALLRSITVGSLVNLAVIFSRTNSVNCCTVPR